MKIRPVGGDLYHADQHDEASSRSPQFCEKGLKTKETGKLVEN